MTQRFLSEPSERTAGSFMFAFDTFEDTKDPRKNEKRNEKEALENVLRGYTPIETVEAYVKEGA